MAPAFSSNRSAFAFAVCLVVLTLLPLVLRRLGYPDRRQLYEAIYPTFGADTTIEQTLFESPRHSDVAMLGSSNALAAYPPGAVECYFSSKLGRPAIVAHLILQRSGLDKQYVVLRDYLKHHTTRLIVAALPWRTYASYGPSSDLNAVLRYDEFPDAVQGVSPVDQARIYSEMVVASPRQLLNLIRPNKPFVGSYNDVDRTMKRGIDGDFEPDSYSPPEAVKRDCLISVNSYKIAIVSARSRSYDYGAVFAKKIADLAAESRVPLILVNVPELDDFGSSDIPINLPLRLAYSPDQRLIALSARELFGDMPLARYRHFFRDNVHMNANGARVFDSATLPALYGVFQGGMAGGRS